MDSVPSMDSVLLLPATPNQFIFSRLAGTVPGVSEYPVSQQPVGRERRRHVAGNVRPHQGGRSRNRQRNPELTVRVVEAQGAPGEAPGW
jgi:hypothetical protein